MAEQITLTIEGRKVKVDPSFLDLPAAEKEATVEEIARSMNVTPKQEQSGVMANVNRGITDSAGGLVDFFNPFDQPHALNPFPQGTGSAQAGLTNVMERGGINVAEGDPETVGQGAARGFGQAAGAVIPASLVARGLSTAGGVVGNIADDAYRGLTSIVGVGAETAAGAASGAAEEHAAQRGAPEWVQNLAAVAAPMAFPATGAAVKLGGRAATHLPMINAGTKVARAIAREAAPYTKTGAQEVAGRRMQDLAGGPERAEELAGRVGGENPLRLTPAQQTGDENMVALEQLAAGQNPNIRERLDGRGGPAAGRLSTALSSRGTFRTRGRFSRRAAAISAPTCADVLTRQSARRPATLRTSGLSAPRAKTRSKCPTG